MPLKTVQSGKTPAPAAGSDSVFRFRTDSPRGLSTQEAAASARQFGTNELTRRKRRRFFSRFLQNFRDPIIRILLGALVINTLLTIRHINWAENIGIAAAVLTATLVSTISETGSEKAFEKLSREGQKTSYPVRRDGTVCSIFSGEIVTGDILLISAGIRLPADGVLLSGHLTADQSVLTGEGEPVEKFSTSRREIAPDWIPPDLHDETQLFRGSTVTSGEGEMLVLRVGDGTFYGNVAAELQEDSSPSPLKERLAVLARNVSFIGYVAAAMIAFAYLFHAFVIDAGFSLPAVLSRLRDLRFLAAELLGALTVAVSVIVVAVPEGLPMMITVVLSSNMKRMLKAGVLVRRLVGIETAGCMNLLFTDKTGTLTTGDMRIDGVITGDGVYQNAEQFRKNRRAFAVAGYCTAFCRSPGKNQTESAFCAFFQDENDPSVRLLEKLPFDSARRMAAARFVCGGKTETVIRSAPELIFSAATAYLAADGSRRPLNAAVMEHFNREWQAAAADTCRVVAVASCEAETLADVAAGRLQNLTMVALFRIRDEIRAEVPDAVRQAQSAGIHVIMMTGDNEVTAKAIAGRCGILTASQTAVLTGAQLARLSDDDVSALLPQLAVVARAVPGDKSRLIRLAQKAGLVAGMTGDGINDAPALKAADVGFAMGSGTDVAREASDIIITDDNFASIIRAVLYGRTIFSSIRKFIVFQLIMNFSAVVISLIGPFIGVDCPVTVIQMLWVNMIMDTLGGLAFAGEPALEEFMRRPPLRRSEPILKRQMGARIACTAAYTVSLCLFFLKAPLMQTLFPGDETRRLTVFFALFVFCGIFNSFNARTTRLNPLAHLTHNKPFLLIMTAVAAVQLALVYFGGETFRTVPLSARELLLAGALALSVMPADLLLKLLLRRLVGKDDR